MREMLRLLQDGRFHSGEELAAALGLSRAAIWKRLTILERDYQLPLQRVRGRGYALSAPLHLLDGEAIERSLSGFDWGVVCLDSVDSTNAEVFRRFASGIGRACLVLSEHQTAGRGRRGRVWQSPLGENLYCSLGLRLDGAAFPLEGLSLTVGLAVLEALRAFGCMGVGLKWPNDVLVGARKIAGILLELSGDPAGDCSVVIGIGVNLNMRHEREAIDQSWTSVSRELGGSIDRSAFAISLCEHLHHYLGLHREGGFASLQSEWESAHLWHGKAVRLGGVDGIVAGVDSSGALRLLVDGVLRSYSGGELSLRLRDDS